MSKSIYEEAIDELTILLYDEFDDNLNNPILNATDTLDKFTKVRNTLEQAQKQKKLLELYIDLANTIEVLDNAYGYGIFEFGEIKYICNKIKEEE